MPPPYGSYAALAAEQVEGVDYTRTTTSVTGATWIAIAIHGGGIEGGSGEAAVAVASGLMSSYVFAGIKSSGNGDLHIESDLFDEPTCVAAVAASLRTLSFHGYVGTAGTPEVALGGLDTALLARVRDRLLGAGFAIASAGEEIDGDSPSNICNENAGSAGVQLELSRALRDSFFPGNTNTSAVRASGQRTATFRRFVAAIRSAYLGYGMVDVGAVNSSRYTLLSAPGADVDVRATVATDVLATGGSHFAALVARYTDASNSYLARLEFATSQTVNLTVRKRVAGTETLLGSTYTTDLVHAANRRFGLRFQVTGSTLRARTWVEGQPEPVTWQVETTDTALTAAGSVGTRSILSSSNTNTLPVTYAYGDLVELSHPQVMTVTRAVDGWGRGHAAGAAVRLWRPPRLAL